MSFHKLLMAFLGIMLIMGCDRHPKADLVMFNGNIYTMSTTEPRAEAVAVANGKIAYVGNNVNANNWVADTTKIIDLNGKTLVPGLIEGHGHLMWLGLNLRRLDLTRASSFLEMTRLVEKAVGGSDKDQWIVGNGWHQEKWKSENDTIESKFPSHDSLTAISKDNPVVLFHSSEHALLANKKALDLAKITSDTEDPDGGIIVRNADGEPTGILIDNAMKLVTAQMPPMEDEKKIEALNAAIEECIKNGITSFHIAGAGQKDINLFHSFLKNGLLKIRLYVMVDGSDEELVLNWFNHGPSIGLNHDFLTVRAIKLVADGALGSRSALLSKEYSDEPGTTGKRVLELDYLMRITDLAYKNGFQVCTHAIGDQANHDILDLYEIVLASDSTKENPRFRIEHAQHLMPEDIPRFGSLGVIASVQSIHLASDRPWAIDRLGQDRIENGSYAWKSLLDQGATVVNGTDVPVEPINPIANFYAAVTRKTLEGNPEDGYEPQERMSREEALKSMTIDAAYAAFEEEIKGSIELGKLADFTILSKDIMTINSDDILSTEVLYTIVNGEILYQKDTVLVKPISIPE